MSRPRRDDRSTIGDRTLTLRLTAADRDLLRGLVIHQAKIARAQGFVMEPTVAGYLRSLIRREAQAHGIERERDDEGQASCVQRSA